MTTDAEKHSTIFNRYHHFVMRFLSIDDPAIDLPSWSLREVLLRDYRSLL